MTIWTPHYDPSYTPLDILATAHLQHSLVDVVYIDGGIDVCCKPSEVCWSIVAAWRVSQQ
jgi:hypothetical protein